MEVASGDDERRRTQDSTNADLRKGGENSPMWKNCGGLPLFSGQKTG